MEISRNASDRDGARLAFGEPAAVPVAGAGGGAAAGGSSRGVVSRVWAAVAALFTSPVDLLALTDVGLEKHLGLLARAKSRLAALEAAAVADLARRRGDKAAADVVATIVREPRGGARRAVKHAKQLAKVAKTADALADGVISPQQAKKIAEAADDTPIDEDFLIDAARRGEPDAFNGAVRRHVNERNRGETLAVRRRRQHNRRYAHIREETDGMFTLHAEFDPIAGRQVAADISARSDHLWRHEDAGDRATPEQRRADAVADLITNSSTGRRGTPSVGIMIHADVDLTAQALAATLATRDGATNSAASAAADAVRHNNANAANPSADDAEATGEDAPRFAPPAGIECNGASPGNRSGSNAITRDSDSEGRHPAGATGGATSGSPSGGGPGFAWRLANPRLDDGTPLTDEEFLAWACDALLLPAVFRAKTQPLWLGRGKRYPTKALRDILEARDGGCAGCDKSVYWCQAHHIVHWVHGGPTDIDNLVLLCNYCHHHKVHALGYTVTVRPDGKYALQPPTSTRHPDNNGTGDLTAAGTTRPDSNGTRYPTGGTRPDSSSTRGPALGALFEPVGNQQTDPTDRNSGSASRSHTVACHTDHALTTRIPRAGTTGIGQNERSSGSAGGSHSVTCRSDHALTTRIPRAGPPATNSPLPSAANTETDRGAGASGGSHTDCSPESAGLEMQFSRTSAEPQLNWREGLRRNTMVASPARAAPTRAL